MIDLAFLAALAAVPATATAYGVFQSWRAARRNRRERCADCAGELYAPRAFAGPSLVQGRLVCEPCAVKRRRRFRVALILAAGITGGAVLSMAGVALLAPSLLGPGAWLYVAGVAVEYGAVFGGALAWMKRANRKAALRLGGMSDDVDRLAPASAAARAGSTPREST